MAGLQRFITYIYYYENEEKKQNTGFAKIEIRGNSCRMEVHIRGLLIDSSESIVYLFARNEKIMQGIPVGNINIQRGNGDVGYVFDTNELEKYNLTMGQMEGIMIPIKDGCYIASQWKEGEIRESFFRILDKNEHTEEKEVKKDTPIPRTEQKPAIEELKINQQSAAADGIQETDEMKSMDTEDFTAEKGTIEKTNINIQDEEKTNTEADTIKSEENIQATEIPLEKLFDDVGWGLYFQKLKAKMPICFPFEGEPIECVQMELKDIKELPRKYWYLGNNSFLLHGFFNYRHIMMGEMETEEGKEYFLGIPGVYQNQEKIMATMFGFPDFKPQKNAEFKTGEFGYWYRII